MSEHEKKAIEFLKKTKTEINIEYERYGHHMHFYDDNDKGDIYKITLRRGNRFFTFLYGQPNDSGSSRRQPTTYDILSGLMTVDPNTFDDFCLDYDYKTDSLQSLELYMSVLKEYENLTQLYNDGEMDRLFDLAVYVNKEK